MHLRTTLALTVAAATAAGAATLTPLAMAQPAHAPLEVGVGRADITPPTGYYAMGWVRSDAVLRGQHTRLFARVIVLKEGSRKLALVAEDLNGIPGGMLKAAADLLRARGFSEQNVLDSASHTHAAPSGFYNFPSYNTVFMTANTPTDQNVTGSLDPQLYAFMVKRLALAIARADDDLGPGKLGWGSTRLLGLTANRSLEAHLADHGIDESPGQGKVSQDPLGYPHTIDPDVEVLRVDKTIRGRDVPVGMWSTFADHGTVDKYEFGYYNADHHGSATRVVEDTIRRLGGVPVGQDVVNAYGNTDEGDQSAGLNRSGPAAADLVGRVEAAHMLAAWREAGRHLSDRPVLDRRWTRVCFCGQAVPGGAVDSHPVPGAPLFTGSEEGRGPLFDLTHFSHEGLRLPGDNPVDPAQGRKITTAPEDGNVPKAVPLLALRIADRVVVSVPGEMTVGMGERVRKAALAEMRGTGVRRAVISGLANEYLSYFTTPEEYEAQHYEGGSTMYGEWSSNLLLSSLRSLTAALASGAPAPGAYAYDPRNGVSADGAPFSTGATSATVLTQPRAVSRLARASMSWTGGPRGFDRPLDRAFVTVQRQTSAGWSPVTSDLGLAVLWKVDDNGHYTAEWQVPIDAPAGRYRFVVTANHYRVASAVFPVRPGPLTVKVSRAADGSVVYDVGYRAAVVNEDLTWWPATIDGGAVRVLVDGRAVVVRQSHGGRFVIPGSAHARSVVLPAGGARDGWGNTNQSAVS